MRGWGFNPPKKKKAKWAQGSHYLGVCDRGILRFFHLDTGEQAPLALMTTYASILNLEKKHKVNITPFIPTESLKIDEIRSRYKHFNELLQPSGFINGLLKNWSSEPSEIQEPLKRALLNAWVAFARPEWLPELHSLSEKIKKGKWPESRLRETFKNLLEALGVSNNSGTVAANYLNEVMISYLTSEKAREFRIACKSMEPWRDRIIRDLVQIEEDAFTVLGEAKKSSGSKHYFRTRR